MLMWLKRYFQYVQYTQHVQCVHSIRYVLHGANTSVFSFVFICFFILMGLIPLITLTGCAPSHAFSDTDVVSENIPPKIQCIYIAPHLTDAGVLKKGHDVCWPNDASQELNSENSATGLIEPYAPKEM